MTILLFLSFAMAQTVSLEQVFKSELTTLSNQQTSLVQSLANSEKTYQVEKRKLENEIIILEKKVASLSAENEVLNEQLKQGSQKNREVQQKKQSLLSTYKKAKILLNKTQNDLKFSFAKESVSESTTSVGVLQFREVADESLQLLKKSVTIEPVLASYYSEEGELISGEMLRYGRIAAQLKDSVLTPSEKGLLQQVSVADRSSGMIDLFVFENLKSSSVLKKTASFWEFLADQIPLLVLSLLMLLVLGLFSLFARE